MTRPAQPYDYTIHALKMIFHLNIKYLTNVQIPQTCIRIDYIH